MAKQKESEIKSSVRDYLRYAGWFVFPIIQGPISYKGISDLIACKDGVTIFVEIKTATGVQSKYQKDFQKDIEEHDCLYTIARSIDCIDKFVTDNFGENNLLL